MAKLAPDSTWIGEDILPYPPGVGDAVHFTIVAEPPLRICTPCGKCIESKHTPSVSTSCRAMPESTTLSCPTIVTPAAIPSAEILRAPALRVELVLSPRQSHHAVLHRAQL